MPPIRKGDASIQAYFPSSAQNVPYKRPPAGVRSVPISTSVGDGFTGDEVAHALSSHSTEIWKPQMHYATCSINELCPGPCTAVTFMGRVVNMSDCSSWCRRVKAEGCLKLRVKDDTGTASVKLWYGKSLPRIRLGSLMTIWTQSVSTSESGALLSSSPLAPCVSISDRDSGCHFKVHVGEQDNRALYTAPLRSCHEHDSDGLMTLRNYVEGGSEVPNARILVIIKGFGVCKRVTTGAGVPCDTVNITVQDDSGEAILSLWGLCASSPFSQVEHEEGQGWKAGETCLLIHGPRIKVHSKIYLTLTPTSMLEVNPCMADVDWLREWAAGKMNREDTNPGFPEEVFDLDAFKKANVRCLYSIAELDEQSRKLRSTGGAAMGCLSVILLESKLHECWRRMMLFCGQCCGVLLYSNQPLEKCKGCEKEARLRLNPNIVGRVADETGNVESGKLLFSDKAWAELLGRRPEDLVRLHPASIKYISDRILFCRITLVFGWSGTDITKGRICVLEVQS